MIEQLSIRNFRGFRNEDVGPLGQVNIVVGAGNSGKTNLLEAVFLYCANADPMLLYTALGLRRIDVAKSSPQELVQQLNWFWAGGTPKEAFEIRGTWKQAPRRVRVTHVGEDTTITVRAKREHPEIKKEGEDREEALASYEIETDFRDQQVRGELYVKRDGLKVKSPRLANIPARFLSVFEQGMPKPLAPLWETVEAQDESTAVVELMRALDPDIRTFRIGSTESGDAYLRIQHTRLGQPPLEIQGSGLGKALTIACNIVKARNGILIIDEFDSSIHIGALSTIAEFTLKAAKRLNVQLFLSTHSLEALDAVIEEFKESRDHWDSAADLRVVQLRQENGWTVSRNLAADQVNRLRDEIGHDLRQV